MGSMERDISTPTSTASLSCRSSSVVDVDVYSVGDPNPNSHLAEERDGAELTRRQPSVAIPRPDESPSSFSTKWQSNGPMT